MFKITRMEFQKKIKKITRMGDITSTASVGSHGRFHKKKVSPPELLRLQHIFALSTYSSTLCTSSASQNKNSDHLKPPWSVKSTDLLAGDGLDDGVVPWVGQVLLQVLERPLAGHVVLHQEPQERQHRQSP